MNRTIAKYTVHQPGSVTHQVLNRHRSLLRFEDELDVAICVAVFDADLNVLELRKVLRNRRGKIELTFLNQHHGCRGYDRLRHGCDTENRVCCHRDLLLAILKTERLEVDDFVVARDQDDRARKLFSVDIPLEKFADTLEPVGIEFQLPRVCNRLQCLRVRTLVWQ